MSLIEIEYGSLASSRDMNNNFSYLAEQISTLSESIKSDTANFSSKVATLNTSVNAVLDYKKSFIQTGMILPCVTSSIPDGFLLCDGSEVLVSDFEDLYAVIGTMFGGEDDEKFSLPDLRNKTLFGVSESNLGVYLTSKLPNIKGGFRLAGTEGSSSVSGAFIAGTKGGSYGKGHDKSASNPLMTFDASMYNPIYSDESAIVQPPALAVNFVIKY
jgi:microcystin-dependent protein